MSHMLGRVASLVLLLTISLACLACDGSTSGPAADAAIADTTADAAPVRADATPPDVAAIADAAADMTTTADANAADTLATSDGSPSKTLLYPFELDDVSKAEDPAEVRRRLGELAKGLPGLPLGEMRSFKSADATVYFFKELAELLQNAKDSLGQPAMVWPQQATLCAAHEAFKYSSLLSPSPGSAACQTADQQLAAALDNNKKACRRIEFPEEYVLDHPGGQVDASTTTTLEGMIALAGEALTHVDPLPQKLLPAYFFDFLRRAIAKIRHDVLLKGADDQLAAYDALLLAAQSNAACFGSTALATFQSDVQTLKTELLAARKWLTDLQAAGLAQAAAEYQAVEASGRKRAPLPYPSLTDRERELLAMFVGGVYWRMRGGGLVDEPSGTQNTRLWYTMQPMNVLASLSAGNTVPNIGLSQLLRLLQGWGSFMDMGRTVGENDKYRDLVDMTQRGKYQVGTSAAQAPEGWFPLLPLPPATYGDMTQAGYDTDHVIAGGLQMGVCYWFAYEDLPTFQFGINLTLPYGVFLEGPTAVGEFCIGAAISLGMTRDLLKGYRPTSP